MLNHQNPFAPSAAPNGAVYRGAARAVPRSVSFHETLGMNGGCFWICKTETGIRHENSRRRRHGRSEEHTSELQSLMRISYAVFCLKKKTKRKQRITNTNTETM